MRVEIKIFISVSAYGFTLTCMRPFALTVVVSKKERPLSLSTSLVNCMCGLIELRWAWNSCTYSFGRQTWLSSTYLYHHLGGWAAVEIALSSTNSITRLAMVALRGEPMAQPNV